jgi:amidase
MIGTRKETDIRDIGVEHVVSRSVRDSAALFAATEDSGKGAQLPPVGFVSGPGKRRLRIGVLLENGAGHSPQPEVAAANASAAKLLASLGHRVDYTHLPFDGGQFIQDFLLLWANGAMDLAGALTKAMGKPPDATVLEPFTLGMVELARKAGPQALSAAVERLQENALAYDTWFPSRQFDVVLSPVLSSPPPKLGEIGPLVNFDTLIARLTEYVGYTPIHNIAGAPSMSVPLNWTDAGLPVGSMLSARRGNERTLFELAYQLEAAQPWAHRIPPIHA